MPRFRLCLLVTAISLSGATGVMWGLAVSWTESSTDAREMPLVRSGAIAVTALAGMCWLAWAFAQYLAHGENRRIERMEAEHRRHVQALIRSASRAGRNPTGPTPRLHAL